MKRNPSLSSAMRYRRKTVLTVDGSPLVRQLVRFALKRSGYEVVEAADGAEALDRAIRRLFDLVLTGQNLPRMDGIALIARLRELPQYRAVPILVLTAESSEAMKARGRAASAAGWLVKPFDPARLVEAVRRLIG